MITKILTTAKLIFIRILRILCVKRINKFDLWNKALIKKQKKTFEGPYLYDKVWVHHGQRC